MTGGGVRDRLGGRGWAYAGIGLGGAVSMAANVAHSFVPPATAAVGWGPHPGAVVGAVFWPIFLFVALEILARTRWPTGLPWWRTLGWLALRFGGLLPVALVAGMVSYRHLAGLLTFYGEDRLTATLGPLAVDGLMVVATGALIATSRHAQRLGTAHNGDPPPLATGAHNQTSSVVLLPVDPARPAPNGKPSTVDNSRRLGPVPPMPAELLTTARRAVAEHQQRTGRPITADELRTMLRVSAGTAAELLHTITGWPR